MRRNLVSGFSKWEKALAHALEQYPFMRTTLKETYKRLIYYKYNKKDFQFELHPAVLMVNALEWAGCEGHTDSYFFGYYDKSPWNRDMQYALLHLHGEDGVRISVVDKKNSKINHIDTSEAWNYQQGSMTQWLSHSGEPKLIYNKVRNGTLGCMTTCPEGNHKVFYPMPIQAVHPKKPEFITINYRRLFKLRPDYGYNIDIENFTSDQALGEDGIWLTHLEDVSSKLIISLSQLSQEYPVPEMNRATHKVNHVIYSPDGSRFVFLYRFIGPKGKFSRLYTARPDGSNLRLLLNHRMVSHYHWQDNNHILVWGRTEEKGDGYYLINAGTGVIKTFGQGRIDFFGDGHCSYSPDRRYVVTDTYPDKARNQRLILFDTHSHKYIVLGCFFSPWKFINAYRCDLHPRWCPDGKWISIDSAHEGKRRTYFLNISKIIEQKINENTWH